MLYLVVLQFNCRAHRDEYVMDVEDPGRFTASNGTLTHSGRESDSTVTIPVDDIDRITFERNTTLHRTRFLGVFFGMVSILLMSLFYALVVLGEVENLSQAAVAGFVLLLTVGGFSTTYEYLRHQNHDVIDIYIETSTDQLVVCERMDDPPFVEACSKLNNSELPTEIRSPKIESELP